MGLVTYSECGNDVSERAATARPKRSRKIHPLTWVVLAAAIPLLVWDARESLKEAKSHTTASESARSIHFGPLNP
jgi:hypothetical protein